MDVRLMPRRAEHLRTAQCHRCGWTGELHRSHRFGHAAHHGSEHYRWLCGECVAEMEHPAGSVLVADSRDRASARLRHPVGAHS
jgi:hypothetical protein